MDEVEFDDLKVEWTVESLNARLKQLKPGEVFRIDDLPNDIYHACSGISCTKLKLFMDCPYKYKARYIDRDWEPEQRAYFAFGRAGHTAILEPHKFEAEYAKQPADMRRSGGAWDAFEAKARAQGKEVLTTEQWDTIPALKKSIEASKNGLALTTGGHAEVSFFKVDPETGLLIKCRADYLIGRIISDLKTAQSVKPGIIDAAFKKLGYHYQEAMYLDVSGMDEFCFVAIESNYPHVVNEAIVFDADIKELAWIKYRKALRDLKRCMDLDYWPMYTPGHYTIKATRQDLYELEKLQGEMQ